MAKPMVVTLPLVLLLLDYWPLGRWPGSGAAAAVPGTYPEASGRRLWAEKAPLLALAALAGLVTYYAQEAEGAVALLQALPLAARLNNALVSCAAYLVKMVWPSRLAVFYPHPGLTLPWWQGLGAALALAAISLAAVGQRHRRPYFLTGWLWFLVTLAPVSGLVQVGATARADRFTYIPSSGSSSWQLTPLRN